MILTGMSRSSRICSRRSSMKRRDRKIFILGIAGGTGSGKSWLTQRLLEIFVERAAVVQTDWYYRDRSGVKGAAKLRLNFDHPGAIETKRIAVDLRRLRMGLEIRAPRYDYATHRRLEQCIVVEPRPII